MKVEIDDQGILNISPETNLEIYALGKWIEDNHTYRENKTPKNLVREEIMNNIYYVENMHIYKFIRKDDIVDGREDE